MQNFLGKAGMQPRKNKFKLKKAWNSAFLTHQMQNFLRQDGVQTPKIINRPTYKIDWKMAWNKAF